MASIVDMVRDVITPDVIRGASNVIGENAVATQSALKVAAPTVLAGALSSSSTPSGAEHLFNTITNGRYGADLLGGVGRMLESRGATDSLLRSGEGLTSSLFGGKSDAVTDAVARSGGVSMDSAVKLLRLAAPLVLSVLGKQIASRGLDAGGLANMLSGERSSILGALPSGLVRSLGLEEHVTTHAREPEREHAHVGETHAAQERRDHHVERKRSLRPALIGGLAALALLFLLTRNRRHEEREVQVVVPPAAERIQEAPPAMTQPAMPAQPSMPSMAPSGAFSDMETYLAETGKAGKDFVLEGIVFESGSANLRPESESAISSLAELLKAHPGAVILIQGHPDAEGTAANNRKLSLDRAVVVKKALVKQGVDAGHIQTKGIAKVATGQTESGLTKVIIVKKK